MNKQLLYQGILIGTAANLIAQATGEYMHVKGFTNRGTIALAVVLIAVVIMAKQ